MTITKCDICGADCFNSKEIEKGKIIWTKRKKIIYIDLCPNCSRNGNTFYAEPK